MKEAHEQPIDNEALRVSEKIMAFIILRRRWLGILALAVTMHAGFAAESVFHKEGDEHLITDRLPGDQVKPQIAMGPIGGFVVWQDNRTDGDGLGISAQALDANFSRLYGIFRVNSISQYDQENPQVGIFKRGGGVFVWQGGRPGFQRIYARFLTRTNTFTSSDITVSSSATGLQVDPRVAVMSDDTVLVTWSWFGPDGSQWGVFGQRFNASGQKIGSGFQVNQTADLNQHCSAISALANGGFVVSWISESSLGANAQGAPVYGIDVMARIFDSNAQPKANEYRLNTNRLVCANPTVAPTPDGGFIVAWGVKGGSYEVIETMNPSNGWDLACCAFNAQGQAKTGEQPLNTYTYGDQYVAKLAAINDQVFAVWTSMGQDGSWEGVYGRLIKDNGQFASEEMPINATTTSRQMQPSISSDNSSRFLCVWSAYTETTGFDLVGQRLATTAQLPKPAPPYVVALSSSRLSVAWPDQAGLSVKHYELYVDGSTTPIVVTNTQWTMSLLAPNSSHSFRLLYEAADGRRSPQSDTVSGVTWGEDVNGDGLPDDWQLKFWGSASSQWPAPSTDSDSDGVSNFQEFLAGTDPADASNVLRIDLVATEQGWQLTWNTQPGLIYQVQVAINFSGWENLGRLRLATGTQDAITVDGTQKANYYRVLRMR